MTNKNYIIEEYDPPMVAVSTRPSRSYGGRAWTVRRLIKTNDDELGFVIVEELPKKNEKCTFVASVHISELITREEWDKLLDDKIQNEIDRLRSFTQRSQTSTTD